MLATILRIIYAAVRHGTTLLFGSTGEIITEKTGNLNLGIPGIMYIGGISGLIGAFFYNNSPNFNEVLAIIIPLITCILGSLLASLLYCLLTVTLRANQNVTGLALTTMGVGIGNFIGSSLTKLVKTDVPYVAVTNVNKVYGKGFVNFKPKDLKQVGNLILNMFLGYGWLVYAAIIIAVVAAIILKKTRVGLHLRAVGENPATADAAGINVSLYKYLGTCIGGVIAGLGGLYFVIDYSGGVWSNGGFGDLGWLAIAIVIFATWKPTFAIFGSYLFGFLYVLYNYLDKISMSMIPIMQMLPYVATIIVLVAISIRQRRESQPPQSLGLSYFREER